MYVLSNVHKLHAIKQRAMGSHVKHMTTADETYWNKIIKRKYEISQEFYQILKYVAVDCRYNLVLNNITYQDRALTCFQYPYQENLQDWYNSETPLYNITQEHLQTNTPNTRAIHLQYIKDMNLRNKAI